MEIQVGEQYRFAYPNFGGPPTLDGYEVRRGATVRVIGPLDPAEFDEDETGPMFEIEAEDGWKGHAFQDELEPLT